jgi:hypothetical protein
MTKHEAWLKQQRGCRSLLKTSSRLCVAMPTHMTGVMMTPYCDWLLASCQVHCDNMLTMRPLLKVSYSC